jgi:hypothetical protein
MGVILTPKFTRKQVRQYMEEMKQRLEQVILLRLRRIGERFVLNARTKTKSQGGFGDRTGNLRNSIGYIVLRNGVQIEADFKRSAVVLNTSKSGKEKLTKGGSAGVDKGKQIADEVAKKFPTGYVLIAVAGMEYAAAVESKGLDVITGSTLTAVTELKTAVREIQQRFNRK